MNNNFPMHIAIIMDGNGRWAKQRGLKRTAGHEEGAKVVREITTHCGKLGVEFLTLYAFSTENWSRPKLEIEFLMKLLEKCTGLTQILALNYGSRNEITRAVQKLVVQNLAVNEENINSCLDTAHIPDVDILIRTSGEVRLSNFLLWQSAYAELFFVQKYWPEFTSYDLDDIIDDFIKRERRFGSV
jgi:undecaprenyl diphosphate synthase